MAGLNRLMRIAAADTPCPTHSVRAFNLAAASENKIHDDTVARRFGFRGALVPGVEGSRPTAA
jgi:hypothetical protein